MNMAVPDPAPPSAAATPPGPSQISLEDLAPAVKPAAEIVDTAMPQGCPFLVSQGGGWRLDVPSRDHRCAAVSPPAALSLEKQQRLCLTSAHVDCATYLASLSARGARLGIPATMRTTRWGITRTTTVIEDSGGRRARVLALILDRRRWPAIPAVILVTTLVVLAFSGLRGGAVTPVATSSPTHATTAAPSVAEPTASELPSTNPTGAPTPGPSPAPSAKPGSSAGPTTFRTYKVKSGDTLSGIASTFGTTTRAIADLNGLTTGTTLHVGQVLKIPNPAP